MVKEFLANTTLFRNLTETELTKVKAIIQKKSYTPGDLVFREGEVGDAFYLVLSGLVKVFRINAQGKIKILSLLGKKDFFGEMALLDEKERSASVKAIEPTKLIKINKNKFRNLVADFPAISFKIIAVLSQRLREANNQIEQLTFASVEERLKNKLNRLAQNHGQETDLGIRIPYKLTHDELANLIGSSRVTVTKLLNKLKTNDKILIKDKYLILTTDYLLKEE